MTVNVPFLAACAVLVGFFVGVFWLARVRDARAKTAPAKTAGPAKRAGPAKAAVRAKAAPPLAASGSKPRAASGPLPAPGAEGASYREPAPRDAQATPANVAGLRLEIVRLDDGPLELEQQLPFVCTHVRRIPGSDRPDYDLFAVETPIVWDGRRVDRVVIGPRLVGARLGRNMRELMVGLAFARDHRLADATELDFEQAEYVAVAYASSIDT